MKRVFLNIMKRSLEKNVRLRKQIGGPKERQTILCKRIRREKSWSWSQVREESEMPGETTR